MNAPFCSKCMFCAPSAMASRQAPGGRRNREKGRRDHHLAIAGERRASDRDPRAIAAIKARPSAGVRFIFQFAANNFLRIDDSMIQMTNACDGKGQTAESGGRRLRLERFDARQFVAFQIFERRAAAGRDVGEAVGPRLTADGRRGIAAADHAGHAGRFAIASPTASVPLANAGCSKKPSGPFQITVFAPARRPMKSATVRGPISRPIRSIGISTTVCASAPASATPRRYGPTAARTRRCAWRPPP